MRAQAHRGTVHPRALCRAAASRATRVAAMARRACVRARDTRRNGGDLWMVGRCAVGTLSQPVLSLLQRTVRVAVVGPLARRASSLRPAHLAAMDRVSVATSFAG